MTVKAAGDVREVTVMMLLLSLGCDIDCAC